MVNCEGKIAIVTPLVTFIKEQITLDGAINIARFMELCLAHPVHGYYMTRDPFGEAGDFTTAPEISQMFGELISLWAYDTWQKMGAPAKVALVELGPGRGTLMADVLRVARVLPLFHESIEVHLVEISPVLQERQRVLLEASGVSITWHLSVETLPNIPSLIIANEFFDALLIRQFVRGDSGWHEQLIGLDGAGALMFGLAAEPVALSQIGKHGDIFELNEPSLDIIVTLSARLKAHGGAALIIDYGHIKTGFGDTLQALKAHKMVSPLEHVGEADITAHVDFEALAKAAAGMVVYGAITQAEFLHNLGIKERAQKLMKGAKTEAQVTDIKQSYERLVDISSKGMGALFKVMAIASGIDNLAGF